MNLEQKMIQPKTLKVTPEQLHRWGYPLALLVFLAGWACFMTISRNWHLYKEFWAMPLTMLFGSFVAGSTPQGGAAIAFPVFTKVLQIPPAESRTFGLMIQSVGMTMASVFIITRRMPIMPRVIGWSMIGSLAGMTVGTLWFTISGPYARVLYTLVLSLFGVALFVSRWLLPCPPRYRLPGEGGRMALLFVLAGLAGGVVSAQTGSGVDVVAFVVLTLAFGIFEKKSIPTTVIIMALTSVYGFFLHGMVLDDIGIVWNYWYVAAPIVAVGAPMGAYFAYRINRDVLLIFILVLITAEMVTTILLVPFTSSMVALVGVTAGIAGLLFAVMLRYRQRYIAIPTAVSAD